jgi:hypothetical protein
MEEAKIALFRPERAWLYASLARQENADEEQKTRAGEK